MIFLTKLTARDPKTMKEHVWGGPNIEAETWLKAEEKIKDRGYLELDGVLVANIEFRMSKLTAK